MSHDGRAATTCSFGKVVETSRHPRKIIEDLQKLTAGGKF